MQLIRYSNFLFLWHFCVFLFFNYYYSRLWWTLKSICEMFFLLIVSGWICVRLMLFSTGEENVKPPQYSCLENPMNSRKCQKDMTLKDELPRSVGVQYATEKEWKNELQKEWRYRTKTNKQKNDWGKVRCCKNNIA